MASMLSLPNLSAPLSFPLKSRVGRIVEHFHAPHVFGAQSAHLAVVGRKIVYEEVYVVVGRGLGGPGYPVHVDSGHGHHVEE